MVLIGLTLAVFAHGLRGPAVPVTVLDDALPAPPLPPGRAVYAATKAYVNAFTQLLHGELAGTGVRVQALTGRPATGCGAVCSRAR